MTNHAKVQDQPETFEQFWSGYKDRAEFHKDTAWWAWQASRVAAVERCCAAVCDWCRQRRPLVGNHHEWIDDTERFAGSKHLVHCRATHIRQAMAEEGGG